MMKCSSDCFSIKWNDFHVNLVAGFQHLLEDEMMADVTLSAGGQCVQAHKIVLSLCSPYFKNLFEVNPCKHPVIIMKDAQPQELLDVVQFIYTGEVNIEKDNLSGFVRLGESLKVKGLANMDDSVTETEPLVLKKRKRIKSKKETDANEIDRHLNTSDESNSWLPKKKTRLLTELKTSGETDNTASAREEDRLEREDINQVVDEPDGDNFGECSNEADEFAAGPSTCDEALEQLTPGRVLRYRCLFCPRAADRKTKYRCWYCTKPGCAQHMVSADMCCNCYVNHLEQQKPSE